MYFEEHLENTNVKISYFDVVLSISSYSLIKGR